jgi:hypothetical protein
MHDNTFCAATLGIALMPYIVVFAAYAMVCLFGNYAKKQNPLEPSLAS